MGLHCERRLPKSKLKYTLNVMPSVKPSYLMRAGCPELFNNKVKNDVIDGYYKKALDSHNVGEAVYRIAIDPKPKLRQCARLFWGCLAWLDGWLHRVSACRLWACTHDDVCIAFGW